MQTPASQTTMSAGLRLVGVTGTNGRTTTVSICRHLLDDSGAAMSSATASGGAPNAAATSTSASIGTIGVLIGSQGEPIEGGCGLTTPGSVELQRVLKELADYGIKKIAMEVSSHGLHQKRIAGLQFDVAVYTNFTHDHLDYHKDMESYFAAKASLVDYIKPGGSLVVNADDPAWARLKDFPRRISFGLNDNADVQAANVRFTPQGSEWTLRIGTQSAPVSLPMIGDVNVYNALGAAAAVHALGMPIGEIAERLGTVPQVPGRLEILAASPTVLRDYAHTPDALRRALQVVRPFTPGRVIVLFGCGGDRDSSKRPVMGAIAEELADSVIITSDNPRTEDPERILDEIEAGIKGDKKAGKPVRIEDRREAIDYALQSAQEGDIVLLAGKGHETYQVRGTTKYPFDEKEIVREVLKDLKDLPEKVKGEKTVTGTSA